MFTLFIWNITPENNNRITKDVRWEFKPVGKVCLLEGERNPTFALQDHTKEFVQNP